jgi:hypothetical protein
MQKLPERLSALADATTLLGDHRFYCTCNLAFWRTADRKAEKTMICHAGSLPL